LNELVIGLKSKLIYWSGGSSSSYDNNNLLKGLSGDNRTAGSSIYSTSMSRPPPPKSIAEIFECAGTILMLYSSFTPGFDKYQCQTLALAACGEWTICDNVYVLGVKIGESKSDLVALNGSVIWVVVVIVKLACFVADRLNTLS